MKPTPIPEASHSLNALAQSAAFYDVQHALASSSAAGEGSKSSRPGINKSRLSKDFTSLAHKSVTSLDSSMKESCCSTCGTTLIPGLTSKIRVRSSGPHQRMLSTTCTACTASFKKAAPPADPKNKSGVATARRRRKARARAKARSRAVGKDGRQGTVSSNASSRPQAQSETTCTTSWL